MTVSPAELAAYPLCAGLSDEELIAVARRLRRVAYMPSSLVMSQEQPGREVFLVASGTLQVIIDQPDGEGVILAVLGPRALVGELSVVQSIGRSASVVTAEKSLLYSLHRDDVHDILDRFPLVSRNLSSILAQRLRLANAQILALAAPDPMARVTRMLLTLGREHGLATEGGVRLPFRLTQSDLGRLTGLARASVNRVMSELARDGLVVSDSRQRITLADLDVLDARCCR